jgi:hypothetical protein
MAIIAEPEDLLHRLKIRNTVIMAIYPALPGAEHTMRLRKARYTTPVYAIVNICIQLAVRFTIGATSILCCSDGGSFRSGCWRRDFGLRARCKQFRLERSLVSSLASCFSELRYLLRWLRIVEFNWLQFGAFAAISSAFVWAGGVNLGVRSASLRWHNNNELNMCDKTRWYWYC